MLQRMPSAMTFAVMIFATTVFASATRAAGFAPMYALSSAAVFWSALLAAALLGTASSTVFLGLVLVAAVRNLRLARAQAQSAASVAVQRLPPVSIFKPLHGAEPRLEENLESFFLQDYPAFEIVFGCRSASDPALAVVERLRRRYPQVATQVVLAGHPGWPSAKVWSLQKMIASSRHDYFVISDSDILVSPDFLRNVIPPLLDPGNGLVTCLYRGVPASNFWSRLEALGMSVEMPSGVITADMLEGMQFALGSVMALRRDVLESCGGIASLADYYWAQRTWATRQRESTTISSSATASTPPDTSFAGTFAAQVRWMQSTRYSRPKGHLGTGLTFAVPFGVLGLIAAASAGHLALGLALLAWSLLNRIVQSAVVGYGVIGDRHALALCWLYPLRDLLGFFVWLASYCGSSFSWSGELYRFTPGGRIIAVKR